MFQSWQFYSILVALFNGTNLLLRKWLFNSGINFEQVMIPFTFFWGLMLILLSFYLCNNCKWKIFPKNNKKKYTILFTTLLASFFVMFGIVYNAKSWFKVDNGARVDSLSQPIKIIYMYLISIILFGNKVVFKHIIGICLALLGVHFVK